MSKGLEEDKAIKVLIKFELNIKFLIYVIKHTFFLEYLLISQ